MTEGNRRALAASVGGRWYGLGPEDSEIWGDWLRCCPLEGVEWCYGVRVGWAVEASAEGSGLEGVLSRELLAKRVDAVGRQGNVVWVVEVKPVGSMSALGQALTYGWLVGCGVREGVEVVPAIVCRRADPDVVGVCGRVGVVVWEVAVDEVGRPTCRRAVGVGRP